MFNSVQQCSIVFNSVLKSLMPLKPLKPLKNKTLKHCDCVGFGLLTARTGDFYCKIKTRQNKTTMKGVLKISWYMWHDRFYHCFIYNTIGCILTLLSVDSLRSSVSESIFLTLRITVVLFWRLTFLECLLWVCFFKFQEFLKISEHSLHKFQS